MKLLVTTPYYLPKMGGLENYAHQCVVRLQRDYGYQVQVVTSNHVGPDVVREIWDGVAVCRLPIAFRVSNTPIHPGWYFSLLREISVFRPDVVWGHMPVPFMADMAARAAKKMRVPFACVYHNDLVATSLPMKIGLWSYQKLFLGRTLQTADVIMATSSYYAQRSPILRRFQKKIQVVSPGVDSKHFLKINQSLLEKLREVPGIQLLFVSQLDKTHLHRGLPVLLRAVKLLKDRKVNVYLRVVGRGDYVDAYRTMAREHGVDKCVEFVGFVSDDELPTYYKAAHILVLPSMSAAEGFGMVMIEAGFHGVAVIASNVGGIPEVIGGGEGLLVSPGNADELAGAIERVGIDTKLRSKLGEALQKKVLTHYMWDKQVAILDRVISAMI